MALRKFKNKGEANATPINADNLNYNFQEILNLICPINKTEIFLDNEDHSNYLGFTWERTAIGKAIVGIDISDTDFKTIGKIGGEKTHKLTTNEMPSHRHQVYGLSGAGNDTYALTGVGGKMGSFEPQNDLYLGMAQATGGNQPHNNLSPYQVFAIWKRTA